MVSSNAGGCISRRGTPLRAYHDLTSASDAARHVLGLHGRSMSPYRCDRCRHWHLCPTERHTPGSYCDACGKQAYKSEIGAERRAAILAREKRVDLRVYPCPCGDGWHLTSSPARFW